MTEGRGKVLMVVTNVDHLPGTAVRTGFFLRELTHPYLEVHEASYAIDIASPLGGPAAIDPHSDPREPESSVRDDIVSMGFLASPRHADKLANTLCLGDLDMRAYRAIFFAGGAGAIFDLPTDASVAAAVGRIWQNGGVVAAVCHGVSALFGALDGDGKPIVAGQEVTGLSNDEERKIQRGVPEYVPPVWIEDEFPRLGATFRHAPVDVPFAVTSGAGRLVTGQNNSSGTTIGRALVAALETLRFHGNED